MSTKQFPIDYSPTKTLYLASLRYGNPSLTLIEVERETKMMYIVVSDATRVLVGSSFIGNYKRRVKKGRVHAFATMLEALDWLRKAAVKLEAQYKNVYEETVELVTQIGTCMDTESKQPGVLMEMLNRVLPKNTWQRVPFSVLDVKETQE